MEGTRILPLLLSRRPTMGRRPPLPRPSVRPTRVRPGLRPLPLSLRSPIGARPAARRLATPSDFQLAAFGQWGEHDLRERETYKLPTVELNPFVPNFKLRCSNFSLTQYPKFIGHDTAPHTERKYLLTLRQNPSTYCSIVTMEIYLRWQLILLSLKAWHSTVILGIVVCCRVR